MLVLSRKRNESIVVDDAIVITVLEIRGDKCRIGIECDKRIPIHRQEVWAMIQDENRLEQVQQQIDEEAAEP